MKSQKIVLLGFICVLLVVLWPNPSDDFQLITSYDTAEMRADSTQRLAAQADSATVAVMDRFHQIEILITETKGEIQAQQQRIKELENELIASQNELEQQRLWLDQEKKAHQLFHRICWAVLIAGIVFFLFALRMVLLRKKETTPEPPEKSEAEKSVTPVADPPTTDID